VPQELRAKRVGNVILSSVADKPWSQYFCCVVAGNRDFVKKNPVATKRAIRGILKGNNVCATEPEATARFLVQRGFTGNERSARRPVSSSPTSRARAPRSRTCRAKSSRSPSFTPRARTLARC